MKVALGLSGGVDSSVAAIKLLEAGHEVVAVTMNLAREGEEDSLAETRRVARRLGLELKVFDFSAEWKRLVVDYISSTYLNGLTPNPCVQCNETVKMGLLPQAAFSLGCDLFATGHYARNEGGRLLRAVDRAKDQSYFLYRVKSEVLQRTVFPLGGFTKDAVRAIARDMGLGVADKRDSQDFCGGDATAMVAAEDRQGNIVDGSGKILGRHRGFWHYTIGKRKGLGIGGGKPYYVTGLDARRNEVVIGFKEAVVKTAFEVERFIEFPGGLEGELTVKVRSAGEPRGPVKVNVIGKGMAQVLCPEGISAVAPGQSAVFYRGDEIVGGGIIAKIG